MSTRRTPGTAKFTLRSAHVLTAAAVVLWLATVGYGQDEVVEELLIYSKEDLGIKYKVLNNVSEGHADDKKLIPSFFGVFTLDFDAHDNYIYFSNIYDSMGGIHRIYRNGTGREIIVKELAVESLAVDWVAKNIYFIEGGGRTLSVLSSRNTSNIIALHHVPHTNDLNTIVVHPNKGYIFFSKFHGISRADMDGSNMINLNVSIMATGLAVDYSTDRLYWCGDAYNLKEVFHSNLDLTDVLTIKFESILPWALVAHKDWMYVINRKNNEITKLHKLTGVFDSIEVKDPKNKAHQMFGLKIYSKHEQFIDNTNPCSIAADYGGCQKLCFAVPSNKSIASSLQALCSCPFGEMLDSDGKTCVVISYSVTTVTTFVKSLPRHSGGTSKLIQYRFVTTMFFVLVHLITVYSYLG